MTKKELLENEISAAAAILGRKGGSVKSEKKAKAARQNGKLGGRPRKKAVKRSNKEQASWLDPNKNKSVVPGRLTPEAFSRRE